MVTVVAQRYPSRVQPLGHPLLERLPEQSRWEMRLRAVEQGPPRAGHRNRAHPNPVRLGNVRVVSNDSPGKAKPTRPPCQGYRQADLGRKYVGKSLEGQSRVVAEDPPALGPEPDRDQILVLPGRKVDQPIDSAPDAHHPLLLPMVREELR